MAIKNSGAPLRQPKGGKSSGMFVTMMTGMMRDKKGGMGKGMGKVGSKADRLCVNDEKIKGC